MEVLLKEVLKRLETIEGNMATKQDLAEVKAEVKADIADVKLELTAVKADVADVKMEVANLSRKLGSVVEQTAGLLEFRTETIDKIDIIQEDMSYLASKAAQSNSQIIEIRKNIRNA